MAFWVKINGVPTRVNSLSNQTPVSSGGSAGSVTWFNATSAQITTTSNTYSEVVSLPFYVTSSNSNVIIDINWSGFSGNGGNCTNYSKTYLDGVELSGSVYTSTPHSNQYTTTHNMHMVSATVGWHTASLKIKNDATAITIDWNTNRQRAAIKVTEEPK